MASQSPTKDDVVDAIRRCTKRLGHPPSKREFISESGITEYWILQHFESTAQCADAQQAFSPTPAISN